MSSLARISGSVATFFGAWLLAFSPSSSTRCAGSPDSSSEGVELVEQACADAEQATACGQRCDQGSTYCSSLCLKKEEPCFKACKTTEEEAKKQKTLNDNKCLSKCADKLKPCIDKCHAVRAACRGKCPSP